MRMTIIILAIVAMIVTLNNVAIAEVLHVPDDFETI